MDEENNLEKFEGYIFFKTFILDKVFGYLSSNKINNLNFEFSIGKLNENDLFIIKDSPWDFCNESLYRLTNFANYYFNNGDLETNDIIIKKLEGKTMKYDSKFVKQYLGNITTSPVTVDQNGFIMRN